MVLAMRRVLVTGMSGLIGRAVRRRLEGRAVLRALNRRPVEGVETHRADIADLQAIAPAFRDVDAVVHLAANVETNPPIEAITRDNVVGTYNVFEAARRAGVKRIVMATSNHAVGFYPRTQTIDHRVVPRPDSRYGVSKAFSEALASLYADKHGIGFLCTRIGNFGPKPIDSRRLAIWISPRDYAQLVRIGLEHPDIRFEIVYGVSNNKRSWYDNANAYRLGYRPQDDSEPYAAAILAEEAGQPKDPVAERYQGGTFCAEEYSAETPPE